MSVEKIFVHGLDSCGNGIGKLDGLAVFVEGALPGEIVTVEIETVKKNYAVGKLIDVVETSPERVKPFCPLYETCGGCQLQHMNYSAQLKWKRQQVVDAVERIGKLTSVRNEELGISNDYSAKLIPNSSLPIPNCISGGVEIFDTLGMENPLRYRNKMQFPVGKNLHVGCYARGSHKIIDTDSCLIQNAGNDKILAAVKKVARKFNLQPYDEDTHRGFLRHVMGRVGCDGELMAVLVTAVEKFPAAKNFVRALRNELPEVTSIQQNIQTFRNNVILGRDTKILYGKPTIHDKIGGLKFNISARSFFQVNTSQAEVLYKTALDFCELHGRETVIDAYCGTGTISLFLAKRARKVFGVEVVGSAINDARKNARENNIRNAEFIVGDAVKILPKLFDAGIVADVVVVDPPRAGCDKKVLETFAAMRPEKIIYVSCNPATLARDLKILDELGYRTKKIQPVDMFPFTSHVESVAQVLRTEVTP